LSGHCSTHACHGTRTIARTAYLNTDLDLGSPRDLTSLCAAFEKAGVSPLHLERREDGSWWARLETDRQYDSPEPNIAAMLDVIEALAEPLRAVWDSCTERDFSIGYDGGDEPPAFEQMLSSALLGRIAALGARLGITIYAPEPGED
jgi:hypothetical protein